MLPVIIKIKLVMRHIKRDKSVEYLRYRVCRCGSNRFRLSACENGGGGRKLRHFTFCLASDTSKSFLQLISHKLTLIVLYPAYFILSTNLHVPVCCLATVGLRGGLTVISTPAVIYCIYCKLFSDVL